MGLGKTVQTLAHILVEKEAGRLTAPALVIAPTSLMGNWQEEAAHFAPGLKVLLLQGKDRMAQFDQIAEADLVLTTTAAEKIYRSDGPVSRIANTLTLGEGAGLAWLPQETILFDRARVRRRFEADLADGAALIAAEVVAFGRAARGERIVDGLFADSWRIRRGGRLA